MREIRTEGVILKSRNLGENDKIVTIFTPSFGKIEAKARGGRKLLSHFTGHLELLSICDFALYRSTREIFTITQCKTIKTFKKIKKDLDLINQAIEITELINLNTALEHPMQGMFEILKNTLERLEQNPNETEKTVVDYVIKLLNMLGFLPYENITKKEIREIMEKHLNLPHMSFSTRKTFCTCSILSKILSN